MSKSNIFSFFFGMKEKRIVEAQNHIDEELCRNLWIRDETTKTKEILRNHVKLNSNTNLVLDLKEKLRGEIDQYEAIVKEFRGEVTKNLPEKVGRAHVLSRKGRDTHTIELKGYLV
jgi:hypothetical protein